MGICGRKSVESLATVAGLPQRPEPPGDLTADESAEWREIVRALPADWFTRETHALLVAYCRHVVAARRVAGMIQATGNDDVAALARLLRMQALQSGALCSLATKMRIAHTGAQRGRRAKSAAAPRPWD